MLATHITPYLTDPGKGKNLCFVKVETDAGIHGWGECYTQADRDTQVVAHVEQLARYLTGRNPANIKNFVQIACDDIVVRRGAMDYYSAISGIEQGPVGYRRQEAGSALYELLGGACRDRIRVYANGWIYEGSWSTGTRTPEQVGPWHRRRLNGASPR